MYVGVNGTRLFFDVEGPLLVPDGAAMRARPTLVLVHGGPGGYDHSYFKPHFSRLATDIQLVYLDLRDHGRSQRHDPADWSYQTCADDLRAFLDAIGIIRPVVLGHSLGGFVALLSGARHPGHAAGLILQSTTAWFTIDRVVAGFRRIAGEEVAELARLDFGGQPVTDEQSERVAAAFGPRVPDRDTLARRIGNPDLALRSTELLLGFDARDQLAGIDVPTLVAVGELDPVTPTEAAREILDGLPAGIGRLDVLPGAGHFPWLDRPDAYFDSVRQFVARTAGPGAA